MQYLHLEEWFFKNAHIQCKKCEVSGWWFLSIKSFDDKVFTHCSISSLTKLGLPVLNMTLQGKAILSRRGLCLALCPLRQHRVQHRMWSNTLHTATLYYSVVQSSFCIIHWGRLGSWSCWHQAGAWPQLLFQVWYRQSIWGANHQYLSTDTQKPSMECILKNHIFVISSPLKPQYIRYQKRGTSVMSNKGSLIDRGDTQIIYRHQHKRSQLNKACRCATISRTYEETASK